MLQPQRHAPRDLQPALTAPPHLSERAAERPTLPPGPAPVQPSSRPTLTVDNLSSMSPPVASPPPRSPSPAAHKAFSRTLYGAALSAVLVIGCWPVSTSGTGGTGGTGGSAGNLSGTDLQVCGGACQKLAACGASLDIDLCKSDCAANPALITCLRSVEASCDPLSSCAFDAFCVSNGYGSGAPVGGAACSGAGTCLVNCGGNVSQSCACSCGAQGSPSVASEYYNLFVCAYQHCSLECGPSGDAGSCNTCLGSSCYGEAQNCP